VLIRISHKFNATLNNCLSHVKHSMSDILELNKI